MLRTITLALAVFMSSMMSDSTRAAIKVERIEYKHGDTVLEGILAFDDAVHGKRPGILVCQEWWGVNDYMESRVRQLAEAGYVAFALDMYGKGKSTTDTNQAGQWMTGLMGSPATVRERAAAGLKVLAERPEVDSSRLAAIGYCMGGTVALELARSGLANTANLKAIVAFHASTLAAKNPADNQNIKGSVLICHGAADTFVKPEQVTDFQKQMAEAKIDYQFVAYAGALHAFTNPNAGKFGVPGVAYDAKADKRSWETMQDLFREVFEDPREKSEKPRSQNDVEPALAPVEAKASDIDKSPGAQAKRRQLIDAFISQGVIREPRQSSRDIVRVVVTPAFSGLDFKDKNTIASLIFAYYFTTSDKQNLVILQDSKTNKEVGTFSALYAGLRME